MNGFENFVYIGLAIFMLFIMISILLKMFSPKKSSKYIRTIFLGLLSIGIGIIIISIFIGGWDGLGYGFIGMSVLVGTILGFPISCIIKPKQSNW